MTKTNNEPKLEQTQSDGRTGKVKEREKEEGRCVCERERERERAWYI